MSYEVIARKWRPQQFDEVIGQSHVTQTLKNAISGGRIAHAFLFSGTRGVGKTTTARILAKALNCQKEEKPTPVPCDNCEACLEIKQGISVDVLEIDGASNRGIDEIRELRESVKYAPAKFRYKVYIIDEVHMLTREAFNALLKTLEEPPKHVVFILATTDVHKIPVTILSRCQRFDFRRVSLKELTASLKHIAESESVQIDDQSLVYIAKAAEGSMRDAQSLLDQIISYSGTQVHQEDVRALLGVIGQETLRLFAEVILSKKTREIFQLVEDLTLRGYDLGQFCKELIEYFRNLIVVKLIPDPHTFIEDISLDLQKLQEQAQKVSLQELQQIFKFLLETESELKRTSYPRFVLEMALIRAGQLASLQPVESLLEKIQQLEEKLASEGSLDLEPPKGSENSLDLFREWSSRSRPSQPPVLEKPLLSEKMKVPKQEEPVEPPPPMETGVVEKSEEILVGGEDRSASPGDEKDSEPVGDVWERILARTEKIKPSLNSTLRKGQVIEVSPEAIVIGFSKNSSFAKEKVEEPDSLKIIRDILHEEFKITPKIKVTFLKEEQDIPRENGKFARPVPSVIQPSVEVNSPVGERSQVSTSDPTMLEDDEQKVLKKILQLFDGKAPQ
ncbi:MAG TPA: DNA polymerase III subunit gamma/tau [Candidatus Limnocylindrales bacterium]|nr:DNA polymerase III subunit gamma/tau [Candidatus Limnocylindrales bacterium]